MLSLFPTSSGRWVHQKSGVVVQNVGDALHVSRCQSVDRYELILNRRLNKTCYQNIPVRLPGNNKTLFLRTSDKHLVPLSPKIHCKDRPMQTYLQDIHGVFFAISQDGHISEVQVQDDTLKEKNGMKLQKIRGYDPRFLQQPPAELEPYAMIGIFSYIHDAVVELKELQTHHGGGNVLVGIGSALGGAIEGAADGGSSIIKAVGGAMKDVLQGAGDLDQKIVESFGHAASGIISSTGGAIKDTSLQKALGKYFIVF